MDVCDENTGVEVALGQNLCERSHLLDTDVGVCEELDVDCAHISLGGVWVRSSYWIGVSRDHLDTWASGEDHLLATVARSASEMVGRISSDVLWDTVVGESVLELIE
jgi:hypothetical protein